MATIYDIMSLKNKGLNLEVAAGVLEILRILGVEWQVYAILSLGVGGGARSNLATTALNLPLMEFMKRPTRPFILGSVRYSACKLLHTKRSDI